MTFLIGQDFTIVPVSPYATLNLFAPLPLFLMHAPQLLGHMPIFTIPILLPYYDYFTYGSFAWSHVTTKMQATLEVKRGSRVVTYLEKSMLGHL